ncbi:MULTISPECIES: hypothetical protein [Brevibacillus]|nr:MULTISPECIES: hypothetical protein [Brevibacillus]MCM3077757.1 hypothetical protein [Brevibacillus invocatus]MCM3428758.1 hypothetical protein [Brevibacillus invocatus]
MTLNFKESTWQAVNCDNDDSQGKVTAEQLRGEYLGLWNTTHTGVLVGQRYMEAVERIIEWLKRYALSCEQRQ